MCVYVFVCQHGNLTNILIRKFVRLMDFAEEQIDYILVIFGWKLNAKLAKSLSCFAG